MSKPSKSQAREEARAAALRLRVEQDRAARRQRTMVITLVAVVLVAFGGLAFWIISQQPEPLEALPDFSEVEEPLDGVNVPAVATSGRGFVVGQEGVAGDPTSADGAVELTVYLDFMCPICGAFEETNGADLSQLRENGDVVIEYRPVSILDRTSRGTQFSTRAATAAAVVAQEAPEHFVAFNDAMFAQQPAEGSTGLSDKEIADIAREAGVPDAVAATIGDGSYYRGEDSFKFWVTAATEETNRDFPNGWGTPTVLLNGTDLRDLGVNWQVPGALAAAITDARG